MPGPILWAENRHAWIVAVPSVLRLRMNAPVEVAQHLIERHSAARIYAVGHGGSNHPVAPAPVALLRASYARTQVQGLCLPPLQME